MRGELVRIVQACEYTGAEIAFKIHDIFLRISMTPYSRSGHAKNLRTQGIGMAGVRSHDYIVWTVFPGVMTFVEDNERGLGYYL